MTETVVWPNSCIPLVLRHRWWQDTGRVYGL